MIATSCAHAHNHVAKPKKVSFPRNPVKTDVLAVEAEAVVAALEIMMQLRSECAYRGRGFQLLNAACHRLSERFSQQFGLDRRTR